jgi:hypothetical protein
MTALGDTPIKHTLKHPKSYLRGLLWSTMLANAGLEQTIHE